MTGSAGEILLNLFFPRQCPYCGRVVGFAGTCSCAPRVGACRLSGGDELLGSGGRPFLFVDSGFACYAYTGVIRAGLRRLKYGGMRKIAAEYGAEMADRIPPELRSLRFDCIVPVPSAPGEIRERGYDVPLLLARSMSAKLAIPLRDDILFKEFETSRQHDLTRERRRTNLLGAFALRQGAEAVGLRILLCDDIVTTGSTMDECAKMLKLGGAGSVYAAAFAATPLEGDR